MVGLLRLQVGFIESGFWGSGCLGKRFRVTACHDVV